MNTDEMKGAFPVSQTNPLVRNIRCPHCGKVGAFHGLNGVTDANWNILAKNQSGQQINKDGYHAGVRICPNPECHSIVMLSFNVHDPSNLVYPFEIIDFDSSGIPPEIIKSFKEALICHGAGCYRACALMVRRTLEEVCEDQKIKASNLKERISALGSKIIIPKDLIDAADELRLLGNDAAHIESSGLRNDRNERSGDIDHVCKGDFESDISIRHLAFSTSGVEKTVRI